MHKQKGKKDDALIFPAFFLLYPLRQCRFCFVAKGGEGCRVVNRSFREHFAVHFDAGFFQAVHETGIVHAVLLTSR